MSHRAHDSSVAFAIAPSALAKAQKRSSRMAGAARSRFAHSDRPSQLTPDECIRARALARHRPPEPRKRSPVTPALVAALGEDQPLLRELLVAAARQCGHAHVDEPLPVLRAAETAGLRRSYDASDRSRPSLSIDACRGVASAASPGPRRRRRRRWTSRLVVAQRKSLSQQRSRSSHAAGRCSRAQATITSASSRPASETRSLCPTPANMCSAFGSGAASNNSCACAIGTISS